MKKTLVFMLLLALRSALRHNCYGKYLVTDLTGLRMS